MPRITEDLVRRRSEHNNCEISTLEELSLHQQDLERIEYLDRWCRNLKILYLQNNLIPRIENVSRMKQLQYLNLALNNVTRVENLEGCECLEKLDLTVNFVGDLLSVESLKHNMHFRELYLTGNPCTDYEGYREFVVAVLPSLKWLDGKEITRSERIIATQKLDELRHSISEQQDQYEKQRAEEKQREEEETRRKNKPCYDRRWYTDPDAHVSREARGLEPAEDEVKEEDDESDWDKPVPFTPETRTAAHKHIADKRNEPSPKPRSADPPKRVIQLERNGKILNINEGKHEFSLIEEEENNQFVLEVACPKFMNTSLIDCDVQPTYVRVIIRGKVLQLVLLEEVSPDKSTARRSQTTGALVITMPKVKPVLKPKKNPLTKAPVQPNTTTATTVQAPATVHAPRCGREMLEVPNKPAATLLDIVNNKSDKQRRQPNAASSSPSPTSIKETRTDSFIDDPDVPPLI